LTLSWTDPLGVSLLDSPRALSFLLSPPPCPPPHLFFLLRRPSDGVRPRRLLRYWAASRLALLGGEDADEVTVLLRGSAELGDAGSHSDFRTEKASSCREPPPFSQPELPYLGLFPALISPSSSHVAATPSTVVDCRGKQRRV
jgi:hypothetical protein